MRLETHKVALAAYMLIHNAKLLDYDGKNFVLDSSKPLKLWEIEYYNSDCYKHDEMVINLRNLVRSSRQKP